LPKAYVVLKPGLTATGSEIQDYIKGLVSPHKQLRGGVEFIDIIPKSAAGEILRRVLRDMDAKALQSKL
jgi:acyl-coenzyme A synthetase/AMP-(fatty) acid ligase